MTPSAYSDELRHYCSGEYDNEAEKLGSSADPGHVTLKAALDSAELLLAEIKRRIEDIDRRKEHLQCANHRCANGRPYFEEDYCSWCADERGEC